MYRLKTIVFVILFASISGYAPAFGFEHLVEDFKIDQAPEAKSSGGSEISRGINNRHLIVWTDLRSGGMDVYGRVFDSSGTALGNEFRM